MHGNYKQMAKVWNSNSDSVFSAWSNVAKKGQYVLVNKMQPFGTFVRTPAMYIILGIKAKGYQNWIVVLNPNTYEKG